MISFTLCLLVLVAGYFVYGRLVERIFGPDDRPTPACIPTEWTMLSCLAGKSL